MTMSKDRKQKIYRAIQEFWVAGTVGAFFAAFSENLPGHVLEFSFHPDRVYTAGLFIRYAYLFWFLVYFFTSNFRIKQPSKVRLRDLGFDALQSIAALGAAYFLGFVSPDHSLTVRCAYLVTNFVIVIICLFSLGLFHKDPAPPLINLLRVLGALFSGAAFLLAFWVPPPTVQPPPSWPLYVFGATISILWCVLVVYVRIRFLKPISFWIIDKNSKANTDGKSIKYISSVTGKKWNLKLEVTEVMPGKSITVTVETSSDDTKWSINPGYCFPAQSSPNKEGIKIDIDLSPKEHCKIDVLRASWAIEDVQGAAPSAAPAHPPAATGQFAFQLKATEKWG